MAWIRHYFHRSFASYGRIVGGIIDDSYAKILFILRSRIVIQLSTVRKSRWRRWFDRNMQHVWRFVDFIYFNQVLRVCRTDKAADVGRNSPRSIEGSHEFWRIAAQASLRCHMSRRLHLTAAAIAGKNPQDSHIVT